MNIDKFIKNNHLKILVKPNSKKTEIAGYDDEKKALRVNVKAPPEDNKANMAVMKFFKKLLKKEVTISKGLKNKEKLLSIR